MADATLTPVIVQDAATNRVLMLAYANDEALRRTRETGEATITFDLCDTVTTFRVRADAFGADGALGQGDATIETAER